MNYKKANVVGSQAKSYRSYNFELEEGEKYLDQELVGFLDKGKKIKVKTTIRIGTEIGEERDDDWRCKDNQKEKGGVHIPPSIHDTTLRIEVMLSNLVKGQENQENFLKKFKADISGLTQKVELYAAKVKQLEHQFGQMYETLTRGRQAPFQVTQFKILKTTVIVQPLPLEVVRHIDPPLSTVDELKNDSVVVDVTLEVES